MFCKLAFNELYLYKELLFIMFRVKKNMKVGYAILIVTIIFIVVYGYFSGNDISALNNSVDSFKIRDSIKKIDSIRIADSLNNIRTRSSEVDTLEFETLERVIRITEGVNNPKSVIISPNGRYAYINNLEGMNTMIINTETYEIESVIEHTGKPVEFAITGNGRYIWISYFRLLEKGYPKNLGVERSYRYPSVVVIYDTLKKELTGRIEVGIIPKVLAVSPDEKLVLVSNWNSDDISVISIDSLTIIKTINVGDIPRGVEFTPDGKYAYVCNFGASTISKIDIETLEVIKIIKGVGYKPRDIVMRSDGKYAYFSNFGDGYLRKLDLETDEVTEKIKIGSEPRSVCITNNNNYIFVANYSSATISAIDTRSFGVIGTYKADIGAVGVALSPDMKYLWVTNQSTGSIIVYRIIYK